VENAKTGLAIFLRLRDFPMDGEAATVLSRVRIPRLRGVD